MKNQWFWGPKTRKIVEKTLPKAMFFSFVFFHAFWTGLGPIFGDFGLQNWTKNHQKWELLATWGDLGSKKFRPAECAQPLAELLH